MSEINNKVSVFSAIIHFEQESVVLDNAAVKELYFVEDIFSPTLTGKLSFGDMYGIRDHFTLTGNEIITIAYGISQTIVRNFYIYKVSDFESINDGSTGNQGLIEIFFVDFNYILFTQRQFSFSWIDKTGSEIIKDMILNNAKIKEEHLGKWEESNEKIPNYYSPFWTINKNFSFLLNKMSAGEENAKRSGFVFYSSTEKPIEFPTFNLVTLQTLLNQRQADLMKIGDDDDGKYHLFSPKDYNNLNKILKWKISSVDKTSFNLLMGGTMLGFDQLTKEKLEQKYKYNELIKSTVILGRYSLFPDISDDSCWVGMSYDATKELMDNMYYDEWIKKYCLQQLVTISVYGHEKRFCGGMIEIPWAKAKNGNVESSSAPTEFDKKMSGGFLVKSITHYFTLQSPGYFQKMVLIKNGFGDVNTSQILKQENSNFQNTLDNTYDAEWAKKEDNLFNKEASTIIKPEIPKKDDSIGDFIDTATDWWNKIF